MHRRRFWFPAALASGALLPLVLSGCGGGSGSGSNASRQLTLSGSVQDSAASRAAGRAVVTGADVKAYVWPDLSTVAGQTTTDAVTGKYTLLLPPADGGKDILLIVTKTVGGVTKRYSLILADVPAGGVTGADIDAATTLTAESVIQSGAGSVTNLTPTAIASIDSEVRKWSGLTAADLTIGGNTLTATPGTLKPGSAFGAFTQSDLLVKDSLLHLADTGSSDVTAARNIAGTLRSVSQNFLFSASQESSGFAQAYSTEQNAVENSMTGLHAFGQRFVFVQDILGVDGSHYYHQPLAGKSPGIYEERIDTSTLFTTRTILVRTGNSADGKSWTVNSALSNQTSGLTLTITPANPISTFGFDPAAGTLTLTGRSAADSSVKYDGTVIATQSGAVLTGGQVHLSFSDSNLTAPLVFSGTLTGTPVSGTTSANASYSSAAFQGTFTSQYGNFSLGSLAVTWADGGSNGGAGSSYTRNLQKIVLTGLSLSTTNSQPATLTVPSAEVDFDPSDSANGYPTSTPKTASLNLTLQGSGYTLSAPNLTAGFTRSKSGRTVKIHLASASGSVNYTSPNLTFSGDVNATIASASGLNLNGFQGNIHFAGNVTPVIGTAYGLDTTLAEDAAGVKTLTLTSLTYGSQTLTGSVVQNPSGTVVSLTNSPSGYSVALTGSGSAISGTIKNGTVTVANVGPANTLGLSELGTVTVIKYSDGTFETAASILP